VTPYLLDTNVLLALAWPNHVHHGETMDWFQSKAVSAFRTCPITQTGFVRISSNPAFTPNAATPQEALRLMNQIAAMSGHGFLPDDLAAAAALTEAAVLATYRQVTDAYLLALAAAHDAVLATLDRGIRGLARHCPERLEIILAGGPIA
jgi:uncharacterized protein